MKYSLSLRLLLVTLLPACNQPALIGGGLDRPRPDLHPPQDDRETPVPPAKGKPYKLDLRSITYNREHLDLLRSSAFFWPKTRTSYDAYYREFPDHDTARINIVEWELFNSIDLADFQRRLEKQRVFVKTLSEKHKRLIIIIALMPKWLSVSNDTKTVLGYWQVCNTHSPRDYKTWNEIVRAVADFFAPYKNVERYYEFWNEPDIDYWQEGSEEFLKLYGETARTVKAADPQGKVGGAAANNWEGRPTKSRSRQPLNVDLIENAAKRNFPLDFVSWHLFSGNHEYLVQAKSKYEEAARRAGLRKMPKWVLSEWNNGPQVRFSPTAPALLADFYYGFLVAGLDIQTISTWSDFSKDPDPEGYGLISQSGRKKPAFHAYKLFDQLSRDSQGVAWREIPFQHKMEGQRRMVVSKKGNGRYEMLIWENGLNPALAAATEELLAGGVPGGELKAYKSLEELEQAIAAGKPHQEAWAKQYAKAQLVYRSLPRTNELYLEFPGVSGLEVLSADTVYEDLKPIQAETLTAGGP